MIVARHLLLVGSLVSLAGALPDVMSANPNPYSMRNADGSRTPLIKLLGRGESGGYNATAEVTLDGFAVAKVKGNYEYLEVDETTGKLVSSGLIAGRDDPSTALSKKTGLKLGRNPKPHQNPGNAAHGNEADQQRRLIADIEKENGIPSEHSHVARRRTPVLGNKVNLLIPFMFSDHTNRVLPSTADLTVLMNNQGPHSLCPTGSVRDVYLASSYNQLILDTTVAPWVALPNTELYYAAGNSGLTTTSHIMIRDALNALQNTGFDFTKFDNDNDGYLDAIAFLHSGYGAEWGGSDAYGADYMNRIWSHKWAVYSLPGGKWTSTSGKSVYNYHISPSVWGTSGSAIGRIGVIAHETGHFFGLPDLYDGSGGSGIGSYCLMANSWGFDGSQYYPPHMSAWSKIQLGWVTPTTITTSGTYTARQGCTYPDIFQISTNFPSGEFLLIENRQRCGFDNIIPGPGLAIFHIDEGASFTTEGYPGQTGWPTNGNHYRVALLQADGTYGLEKGQNRGDAGDLFFGGGVNGISSIGTSTGSANPNTKTYKGGVVQDTGISITSISTASSSMTFNVNFGPLPPTPAPSMPPANQFLINIMTDDYSSIDTSWTLSQTSASGSTVIASRPIGYFGNNALYTEKYTLGPGNYEFDLYDDWGDGLLSPAYYTISLGGVVLKTGGAFSTLDSTVFTVGTGSVVTSAPVTAKPVTAKPSTAKPVTAKPVTAKPVTLPAPKPVKPVPKPVKPVPKPVKPVPKPAPKPAKPAPKPAKPAPKPAKPAPKPAKPAPKPASKPIA